MNAKPITILATAALVVKPGDHVLISMPDALSAEEAHLLVLRLRAMHPDVEFTIISGGPTLTLDGDAVKP